MDWNIPPTAWALALGSGVLMGLGLWAGFAAYRGGKASIVTAIVALYPVLTVILAIAGGEPFTVVKGLAIAMALAAGLTMAYEPAPALVQAA
jgi:drug/metabolite transporter (DMT)-like permease